MSLALTSEMLAAAYEYLRTTLPFRDWGLPEGEDVKFVVGRSRSAFAFYQWDGRRHTITVSVNGVGYTGTLMAIMAHEMIHLHLEETGMESRGSDPNVHNGAFRHLAKQVCKLHGFDPKAFY